LERYNLIYKNILGILMAGYIATIVFLNLITPNKMFSETENRMLEQKPTFSLESLFQGKFTKDYETFISDQFIFRNMWIGLKSDSERALLKNESNGVYLSKNDCLIQAFIKPDSESFMKKIDSINEIAAGVPDLKKYFMLVPNAAEIFKNKLPAYAPNDSEKLIIGQTKKYLNESIRFVDVTNALDSKKDEYIFYKTDHHWTSKGAFYAYSELSRYMGFTAHDEGFFNIEKVVDDDFYGSLSSRSGYQGLKADSIELYIPKKEEKCLVEYIDEHKVTNSIYNMESLKMKDKYGVFFGGNHGLIKITTNTIGDQNLLVVKDSYANSLIPFLTGNYSEIYVVDLRYYEDDLNDLIKKNKINELLILYNVNTLYNESSS